MSGPIRRFEDLIAWQKARELTKGIYGITNQGPFGKDFALKDQIRRASISIMSNIAEGFERSRPKEFHQFLSISKCSCGELRSQLYIALDAAHIDEGIFCHHLALAEETSRIINGLRASVKRSLR